MDQKLDISFIGGELYIRFSALVELGVPETTIKDGALRGDSGWHLTPDPQDSRARLVAYEPLRTKYKTLIQEKYGCPYRFAKMAMIEQAIPLINNEDRNIIDGYELPGGQRLSTKEREKYKRAARVLAYLSELPRLSKSIANSWGFDSADDFWVTVRNYIKKNKIALPTSRRLEAKVREYQEKRAIVVIHEGRYGNKNGEKLNELHRLLLAELMADPRKFSIAEVSRQFMAIAEEKGWEDAANVTYQAIFRQVKKMRGEWELNRHGEKWDMLNREIVINQRKASAPNIQWQIDGTPAALWYFNLKTKQLEKLYVVSVIDSHSDAIIGYAFGYTETTQLIAEALKMAIQLQGAVPYEIRSDKGSSLMSGETKALFKNLGCVFKPTTTGRARAKSVEGAQRWWMQRDSVYYFNRSGMNVTAKTQDAMPNPDALKENLSKFPTSTNELMAQIMESIALYNKRKRRDGLSPAEKQRDEQPNKREFNATHLLEYFGMFRKKGKKLTKYRFSNEGLEMQVQKHGFRYLPAVETTDELAAFMNQHSYTTEFYVKYDPTDLEEIGLYSLPIGAEETESSLRFECYASLKQLAAQVQSEASDEEKATLKHYRETQKAQKEQKVESGDRRKAMLQAHNVLAGAIQIENVHKDSLNKAKIEVQRLMTLGYGELITEDLRAEQAAESTKETKRLNSINIYLDRYED